MLLEKMPLKGNFNTVVIQFKQQTCLVVKLLSKI